MNELLTDFARRCTSLRRQIEMIAAGDLRTRSRSLQHPTWTDDTMQSRQTAADNLANYERLIAQYSSAA